MHKSERKEKFGCTGIFGSRIFYKHLQWCVDEAEWKRKTFPKEEKSSRYWKDIIFMLLIYSLWICHSRNFLSGKQRSENWFCLNNPVKPCRYIFHFHYFFSPRLLSSSYWCYIILTSIAFPLAMLFLLMNLIFAWNVTCQPSAQQQLWKHNSTVHSTNQQSPDHSYFWTEEVNCPSCYHLLVQRMKGLAHLLSR